MGFFNKMSLGSKMVNCEDLIDKTQTRLLNMDSSLRNTKNLKEVQVDDYYRNSISKILKMNKDIDRMFLKEKGDAPAIPTSVMDNDFLRITAKVVNLIQLARDMESRYNISLVNEYYI